MKKSFSNSKEKNLLAHRTQGGFTVLEMAFVVIIAGIVLAFLGSAMLAFMEENQVRTTEHRMEQIGQAIDRYLSVNGRYPCPANRFLDASNPNFGRDSCILVDFSGTVQNATFHIGAVPTRTLNFPDEYLSDAWGRKFTYAVSTDLTDSLTYRADLGTLRVNGVAGTVLDTSAHYAVISHGISGNGAFSLGESNSRYVPCSATSQDRENCDDDRNFVSMLVNSEENEANYYDDYVLFKGLKAPLTFPAGAIMSFNVANCPPGWIDFLSAEGRFIAGSFDGATTHGQETLQPHPTNPSANINFNFGVVADSTTINIQTKTPAYVALNYCEKLPR